MPDALKKVVVIFDHDGINPPKLQREYKSVQHDGEGAPRDVEISADERMRLFGIAHGVSTALVAEAQAAQREAEDERDAWKSKAESRAAKLEAAEARIAELEQAAKAAAQSEG